MLQRAQGAYQSQRDLVESGERPRVSGMRATSGNQLQEGRGSLGGLRGDRLDVFVADLYDTIGRGIVSVT
jgi:hypothetical protein